MDEKSEDCTDDLRSRKCRSAWRLRNLCGTGVPTRQNSTEPRSQLFARYCAAQRYREKSRKSGRPSGVGMSVK